MAPEDAGGQQRIDELERRLADAMRRIEALEAQRSTPEPMASQSPTPAPLRQPVVKPPVIVEPEPSRTPAPRVGVQPEKVWSTRLEPYRPPAPVRAPSVQVKTAESKNSGSAARLEYDLGAKVMPWVGSLVVIVAIGFLIGNGIERGWLTPWMQFGLAMMLSASFIGIGFWKRSTREDFGGILIGLGSCGVFLCLAGGQIFHQLYSKETLVGSFFAWGLANLGYSTFTRSRAFLVIGFIGGLAAALMPLAERNVPINLSLHFAVIMPALFIAVRHKWLEFIATSWFVSCLCLLPATSLPGDWMLRAGAFALNGLLTALAYTKAFRDNSWDPKGQLSAFMVGAAGLAAILIRNDAAGAAGIAVVAGTFGLAAYLTRTSKVALPMGTAAAAVAVLLIPLGFRGMMPATLYAVFACVCTLVSLRWTPATSMIFAGISLACSMLAYMIGIAVTPLPAWMLDLGLLSLIAGSATFVAWGSNRVKRSDESWTFVACVVALPILARMAWVGSSGALQGVIGPVSTIILTLLVAAITLVHLAGRRWSSANGLAWFTGAAAGLTYISNPAPALAIDLSILLSGVAATIILCRSTRVLTQEPSSHEAISNVGSVVLMAIAGRMAWIIAAGPLSPYIAPINAVALTGVLGAIVLAQFSGRRWASSNGLAWLAAGCAGACYAASPPTSLGIDLTLLLTGVAAVLVLCRASLAIYRQPSSPEIVSCIGSAALLVIASRLAWIAASGPLSSVIDPISALTFVWLAAGVAITALLDRAWRGAHVMACFAVCIAGLVHMVRLDLLALPYPLHLTLLLAAVGSIWCVGRRSIAFAENGEEIRQVAIGIVGALMASVSGLAVYYTLRTPLAVAHSPSVVISMIAASAGCSAYFAVRKWASLSLLSGGFAFAGFVAYLWPILVPSYGVGSLSARISAPLGVFALPLAILVLASIIVSAALSCRMPKAKPAALILAMGASWPMFVQCGLLSTAGLYDPAHWNWVISGFWALYGSLVLALGFIRDERILRFGSFAFLAATVTKIFTWDLGQQIDPVLRVVILLFLGLAMLGGGYTYIKTRAGREDAAEAVP